MEKIAQYLVSVTAAAVISSVIISFQDKNSSFYPLIRLLCGLFMSVTLLTPLIKLRLPDMRGYLTGLQAEAQAAVSTGTGAAEDVLEGIIKSRTESYILDKASSMGLDIRVEVLLAEGELPQPCGVQICGNAAPYKKRQLQLWIREALAISEEAQIWS